MQILYVDREFVLVTDVGSEAIYTISHQVINGLIYSGTRVIFYSRERWFIVFRKECLAVIYGCKKFHAYFKHKDFELHCCSLVLCWSPKRVKNGVIH